MITRFKSADALAKLYMLLYNFNTYMAHGTSTHMYVFKLKYHYPVLLSVTIILNDLELATSTDLMGSHCLSDVKLDI
jgi:hypothetical protein